MCGHRNRMQHYKLAVHLCLTLTLLSIETSSGARILMSSPQMSSHIKEQLTVGEGLVSKGHEVYVALGSRYHNRQSIEDLGIRTLVYHIPDDVRYGVSKEFEIFLSEIIFSPRVDMPETSAMVARDCEFMMGDQVFLDTVRGLGFNLALVEPFLLSPCTLLLPRYLGIPFVSMATLIFPWMMRVPALPSFYPLPNPFKMLDETTLLGRTESLFSYIVIGLERFFPGTRNTTLLQRFAPELDSWGDLVRQSELFMVSNDHHLGSPLPTLPNIISVAGLSCKPAKHLDLELAAFVARSNNGIIVMSFGSMAYYMPQNITIKFLDAFSKLKESVVARMARVDSMKIPENVKLVTWLPQNDILGHSKTKLFITHCGSGGQHEALYHAVPTIGFPLFAEQDMNCRRARLKGFGLEMNVHDFTSEELYVNIKEVISNPSYAMTVKRASTIFRDQPTTGAEKAVYWIEHVIKYGGEHLRSPAMKLPLYQFLMLDVLALLLTVVVVLVIFLNCCIYLICTRLCLSKKRVKKPKSE